MKCFPSYLETPIYHLLRKNWKNLKIIEIITIVRVNQRYFLHIYIYMKFWFTYKKVSLVLFSIGEGLYTLCWHFLSSTMQYVNNISMPFGYGLQFSLRLTLALGIVTYAKYLSHIWHVRSFLKQWSQNSMNSIMQ